MPVERAVYVLDDDEAVLRSLERLLSSANFEPITFNRPDLFLTAAKTFKTGCVLLDVRLPDMSGLEVQAQLNRMRSDLSVIIVTAQGDIQTAVRAMKAGASDFLEKPYTAIVPCSGRSRRHLRKNNAPRAIAISPTPSDASESSVHVSGKSLTG
jgi:two-component system, LuxR family, response regulator FixJ